MKKTILLADDSPTIRKVVELTFSDSEFNLESVATGEQALLRFEHLRPDLVLADVVMPPPDGYELCRAIKRSSHRVPVLLLAGTFESFDEQLAASCGADGHLRKPFESRVLVQRVHELLRAPEPGRTADAATAEPEARPATQHGASSLLAPEAFEALVQAVVARLAEDRIREVVEAIVPPIAERIIRERIAELERDEG